MKATYIITALICLLAAIPASVLPDMIRPEKPGNPTTPASAVHPLYSKYSFGKDSKVIDFGVQPLGIPIGVIGEVMKHDQILKKSLKKKGMEIRFHPFLKGADLNYFFRRGDIEVAMAGDLPTLTLASASEILIVGLVKQGSSSVVAKKTLLISDLRGKRIGYPEGSTAHYGLLIALSSAGLKESDVKLVPMEITELAGALAANKIDAFSAFEPVPVTALARHKDFVVIQRLLNSSYLYLDRSFATRNPEAMYQVMAAFVRAIRWMKLEDKNLIRAAEWTMKAGRDFQGNSPDISVAEIAQITRSDILQLVSDPFVPQTDFAQNGVMHRAFEYLKKQGKVPASASWERIREALDYEIMNRVVSNSREYLLNSFDYKD